MNKPNVALVVAGAVVLAGVIGYPFYFDWWDHRNCSESGGTWDEAQDACIEPRNADIPNTGPAEHDKGGTTARD